MDNEADLIKFLRNAKGIDPIAFEAAMSILQRKKNFRNVHLAQADKGSVRRGELNVGVVVMAEYTNPGAILPNQKEEAVKFYREKFKGTGVDIAGVEAARNTPMYTAYASVVGSYPALVVITGQLPDE